LGAAGMVGAALCRAIAAVRPRALVLFDRNESALYYLEIDLLREPSIGRPTSLVGDVADDERLRPVLATYRPDVVIHAAGYPDMAFGGPNTEEMRRNTLLGAARVLDAAVDFGVAAVLMLSTDERDADGELLCISRGMERYLQTHFRPGTVV